MTPRKGLLAARSQLREKLSARLPRLWAPRRNAQCIPPGFLNSYAVRNVHEYRR